MHTPCLAVGDKRPQTVSDFRGRGAVRGSDIDVRISSSLQKKQWSQDLPAEYRPPQRTLVSRCSPS